MQIQAKDPFAFPQFCSLPLPKVTTIIGEGQVGGGQKKEGEQRILNSQPARKPGFGQSHCRPFGPILLQKEPGYLDTGLKMPVLKARL